MKGVAKCNHCGNWRAFETNQFKLYVMPCFVCGKHNKFWSTLKGTMVELKVEEY